MRPPIMLNAGVMKRTGSPFNSERLKHVTLLYKGMLGRAARSPCVERASDNSNRSTYLIKPSTPKGPEAQALKPFSWIS